MLTALPALLLLIGFPHFGLKPSRVVSPADSLPPPWKSASRLALEDRFVLGSLRPLVLHGPSLRLYQDPRSLHVTVAPDSGTVSTAPRYGEIALGPGARRSLSSFATQTDRLTFQRLWRDRTLQSINVRSEPSGAARTSSQGFTLKLPSPLPKRVQSLLGPGGPALSVSGSENIRLSGQSNWTNQQVGPLGQRRSLFPTLTMQQDLDIRLEGQLSDRIKVNLLQNSANQVPLANRIAINYRGDEDDLVQALDLGNTSLTLPGTQYVSYSGRNEGLFGVKTALRYGPLDFTVLASKQEGKSERATYAGGASKQEQTLADFDYVRGVYYFLYDPSGVTLDIEDASVVVYRDNADYSSNVNTVRGRGLADPTRFFSGDSLDTVSVRGAFRQLQAGSDKDYEILTNVYGPYFKVLRLRQPMVGDQTLAVTYRARAPGTTGPYDMQVGSLPGQPEDDGGVPAYKLKLLRVPQRFLVPDSATALERRQFEIDPRKAPFNVTRELELKNFYQLAGQRIDPATLKINIRQYFTDPPVYTVQVEQAAVPYLELLGLDSYDESGGVPVFGGHDGKVDGTGVKLAAGSALRSFVDYENGVLFFPDPRPFAPRLGEGGPWFDKTISGLLSRRETLTGPADPHTAASEVAANAANTAVYDNYLPRRNLNTTYLIDVEFTAAQAQGEIVLGRGNILDNSEVVTVGGQQWTRDRDYTIDYDLGRLTLKRQLGPGDQLSVNYSYAPLFMQAGRTLVGSAFRLEGREKSLGGAFLYESKGAQDLRPRLGEEPSRSLITDLNTEWTFRPDWMTRMADRLPGVRTTTPSELHVQAEMGMSFPNPNTKNEVFVDDMEGVRDAVSLPMTSERWHWSGAPLLKTPAGVDLQVTRPDVADTLRNAETHWYAPPSYVKEKDLKPNLSDAQGAKNPHQSLAITAPRRPSGAAPGASLWAGITYPLDQVGLDLSQSQFIELWVNDFFPAGASPGTHRIRGRHVRLHIDLGTVSEDQMRSPDVAPNDSLDTEDQAPRDNVLIEREDTGLDGLFAADEPVPVPARDLVTAGPNNPEGDKFSPPDNVVQQDEHRSIDPRYWRYVNGTEDNRTINPLPDTEDLNLNGSLDKYNDYLEYTIDLGDEASRYLVTDVQRDFGTGGDNSWRRYRIPISDSLVTRFGNPNLAMVQHVRVWLQGIVECDDAPVPADGIYKPLVMLGGLDVVGSRWQQVDLDSTALAEPRTTLTLNSVNSVDNADIYVPPFDPGQTRNGNQELTRREQSISMEFTDLKPGATLESFKTFSLDENYSRYGALDWFAAAFEVKDEGGAPYDAATDTSLFYFVRFASDEQGRNYYEYRARLPRYSTARTIDWRQVKLTLTDLSNLKLDPRFPVTEPIRFAVAGSAPGESLVIRGRPSFTRLRRISFGLLNLSDKRYSSGQLWFDELRATDVAKDVDRAQRIQLNGRLANLFSYNLAWNGRGADFLSVGESRGSGSSSDQLSWNSNIELHRFIEKTGIILPLNLNYSRSSSRPRFSAGDDIVRSGALQAASETRTETRSFSTSYSRAWSERSNPLLRYTLGGITAGYGRAQTKGRSPYSVDSTVSTSATVNYQIAPRKLLAFGLPASKARFYLLPERAYWNYSVATSRSVSFERVGAQRDSLRLRSDNRGRSAFVDFGADSRPIDLFHHHVEARRNLTLPSDQVRMERIGFINLGRVTSWRQSMDARYSFNRGTWVRPTLSWNSSYTQNNGPELSRDLSVRAVGNGQSLSMNWDLPFDRLDAAPAGRVAPRPPPLVPALLPDSLRARPGLGLPGAPGDSVRARMGVPPDTARVRPRRPVLGWRQLVARLGGVSTDLSFNKSSNYSRLTGTPGFSYLFGLSSQLDTARTRPLFGNDAYAATDWRAGGRSRIRMFFGSAANTRFDVQAREMVVNGVRSRTRTVRFPDLDMDYGRVAGALHLTRFLTNPQLRTAYGRSVVTEWANNRSDATGVSRSSEWRPLLGLTGSLKSGARTELRIERRNTERENRLVGRSITSDRLTTVFFSINRSYSQGQKVSILGKQKTVSSTVTVGLTSQYETISGETIQYDANGKKMPAQFPKNESRLSVNATGSYAFSTNVTGNASLGYGQNTDKQRDIRRRNVRVEVRAQFTF